ncbi:universal stress protein [Cellulomonas carbonis]|uniref:Universal stress protein UspA n=1 Tax=Cellulomonas carbonis T26 TaxID=947969 RepID=A0A0A0BRA0_9CELL|nr:universal stress protein [Cellulomonas carbonis]KGM10496.1 universal stress protein UspA [Cellulomonas carbonis T26]GGC03334.1 universal stress protein [Cellulomonas carbonis]
MTIIVGYTPTPEGEAALDHAVMESHNHGDELLVVNVSGRSDPPETTFASDNQIKDLKRRLDKETVPYTVRQLVRGRDAADEILALAEEHDVRGIVIGVRHRTPVGKLLLGSNSQRILLEARCPVIAVKGRRPGA